MESLSMSEVRKSLSPREFKEFIRWMNHQTIPVLDNGEKGVYAYDLRRWLEWKRHGGLEPIWD